MSKADLEERIRTLKELCDKKDTKILHYQATISAMEAEIDCLRDCISVKLDRIYELVDIKQEEELKRVPPSVSAYEFACDLTDYCKGLGDADGNYFLRRIDMLAREVWRCEHPLSDGLSLIYTNPDEATI